LGDNKNGENFKMKEKEQMEKFQTILKNLGIIQKGYKVKCIKEIENDGKNQGGLVIWWHKNNTKVLKNILIDKRQMEV
jgi:hypothetical protein